MKQILLFLFLSCSFSASFAQSNQWTWLQGDSLVPQYGLYGTKGMPATTNKPGARLYAAEWRDKSGDFWLFGGRGYTGTPRNAGYLNDLWKYTAATKQWTWMAGDNLADREIVYGTKRVPDPANKPGGRQDAASWIDISGNLWLFGGFGNIQRSTGSMNDLWKYDPTSGLWTWMSGDSYSDTWGFYYDKGTPSYISRPGSRQGAVNWTDAAGNLWLFGGLGYDRNAARGYLNDLWMYAPAAGTWTWVAGDDLINPPSSFGIRGTADSTSKPGGRQDAAGWTDTSGNFWLFGGKGVAAGGVGMMNELWKYTPATGRWTWVKGDSTIDPTGVYGARRVADSSNTPAARYGAQGWTDATGNGWLQGGFGVAPNGSGVLNDLWRFDPSALQWTWMNGGNASLQTGSYGTLGVPDSSNAPRARFGAVGWTDLSGDLWLMGGNHNVSNILGNLTDLWKYSVQSGEWSWMGGDDPASQGGIFGTKGTGSSSNIPSGRELAVSWTDPQQNLWLFGGSGYTAFSIGSLNDLWKWAPLKKQWTWIGGDSVSSHSGVYGTKGMANAANKPGARYSSTGTPDASGNLWLFGGVGFTAQPQSGELNDLWKYTPSTNQWTWVSGDSAINPAGVYGTKNLTDPANKPAPRYNAISWMDNKGNFWLFGGGGIGTNGFGTLNDTWKFNTATGLWTWVNGDNTVDRRGTYGQKGVAGPANTPGARSNPVGWKDANGNLWLFGGFGYYTNNQGYLNDLWMLDPNLGWWTWMGGDNIADQTGIYGKQGVAGPDNKPGGRDGAHGWTDAGGNFWLMGGFGFAPGGRGSLNDLWKYTLSTGQWTWMGGDTTVNQPGVYAAKGTAAAGNKPGSRSVGVTWTDAASGKLYLFGGEGYAAYGYSHLNDLWQYSLPGTSLPVTLAGFTAQRQQQTTLLKWSTTREENSRTFVVEKSANAVLFDSIGTVACKGTLLSTASYSFTDPTPFPGANYYRLKLVDRDGKFTYSSVKKVTMDAQVMPFSILQNPVRKILQLGLQLSSDQKFTVQVRSMGGQLLLTQEHPGKKGDNMYTLPVERLAPGNYLVSVQVNGKIVTKPFVKQ